MKKVTYTNTMPYTYDAKHANCHYILDNGRYQNRGQICEHIAKYYRGLYEGFNPTSSYDVDDDIPELNASVKSAGAALASKITRSGANISTQIKIFFKNVHSKVFIFVDWNEKTQEVNEYWMDKREFGAFIQKFTTPRLDSTNNVMKVRFRTASRQMKAWFDARL